MRVALITKDKDGALQARLDNRDAHLAYIAETGVVEMAGPFLNDEGTMCGSLIILEVDSMDAAQTWADNDPYIEAGVYAKVVVKPFKRVF